MNPAKKQMLVLRDSPLFLRVNELDATLSKILRLIIDGCSGSPIHYTQTKQWEKGMAFVRRKEIRSIWCTTCAAAEKCANFILPRLGDKGSHHRSDSPRKFPRSIRFVEATGKRCANRQLKKIIWPIPIHPGSKASLHAPVYALSSAICFA